MNASLALSVLLLAPATPADERISEVSYFFFGIRMRSTSSGTGDSREGSGRSRRKPSDKELASAPHTCPSCERDEHGRMKVLTESRSDFLRATGYPYGRKGYVIDYIVPLQCGGADAPANMRWRRIAGAQARDVRCAR
jgi:hypothetical protein